MSLFKRPGSPFWYCEFTVKGTRITRSTQTASRREAERFQRDLRRQAREEFNTKTTPSVSLTLDQACGKYWVEHGYKLRDARNVERWLRYVLIHLDGGLPITELSDAHVNDLVAGMRKQGTGEVAINRTVVALQGVHNRASKYWKDKVLVIHWKLHKTKETARTNWISVEQAQALLAELPEHTRRLVMFMLTTGIRQKEAFELRWDRVSLERSQITIIAKGGITRDVELSAEAAMILAETPRIGDQVFDTTNWRRHFDKAKRTAGVSNLRWHDLRHTFASWLGRSGASLDVIKNTLGHSSITVTQKYRHVATTEVREALNRMPTIGEHANVVPLKRKTDGG